MFYVKLSRKRPDFEKLNRRHGAGTQTLYSPLSDGADDKEPSLEDGKIKTFDDHEDSVYCVEWSATDPWVFASLSYDGRLVINHVPRSIKFRILNLV